MTLTVRKGSTVLSPQLQPHAYYQYDFATRRVVRVIETIVPTLSQHERGNSLAFLPADRFYCHLGLINSSSNVPAWLNGLVGGTYQTLSGGVFYWTGGDIAQGTRLAWPTGFAGDASSFAPKNTSVTKCVLEFRAAFTNNADYNARGIGLAQLGASSDFTTAHHIAVCRNAGVWQLGTADGTTRSESTGGTADGSFHDFRVEWETAEVRLYVDGTLTVTKTTNLPNEPLAVHGRQQAGTEYRIVDILVRWE